MENLENLEIIKEIVDEMKDDNKRFWSNDNVSPYISENDLYIIEMELTKKFEEVLDLLLIDRENDPNSKDTPRRLSKMFLHELFEGRYSVKPKLTNFPNEGTNSYTGMLVVRAEIKSACAHHWQPVRGTAYIGIMPNGSVLGLSKYVRLARWHASRGVLQEELCTRLANDIALESRCKDVAVYLEATHGCLENRGVEVHSSLTQTTVLLGEFQKLETKNEFFQQIQLQKADSRSSM